MKPVRSLTTLLAALSLGAVSLSAQTAAPKTDREKLGYALGVDVGQTLKKQPIDFDQQFFMSAIHDTMTGSQAQMTDDQVKETLTAFSKEMRAKQQAQMAQAQAGAKTAGEKNKKDGAAFLATNKAKAGVQTLPSGLQYKVLAEGSGSSPKATDKVTVKYRGTLIDGTEFDSSATQPGGTVAFPVNGVIPGWTEALQKMKPGAKWQLFIPSDLAYGDAGSPPTIAP